MDDPHQSQRIDLAVYGNKEVHMEGLLSLIDQQHTSDSCRAYQCIKTLVAAANKSKHIKNKLLEDPGKWQWAVNWLKDKMDEDERGGTINVPTAAEASSFESNEDSLSRTFQRTTSAVVTLAEANAILAGFDDMTSASSGRIDMDQSKRLDEDEEMPDLMDMKD